VAAAAALILDAHLESKTLIAGLKARGFELWTLSDLELPGDAFDSTVARRADEKVGADRCVLVTIDVTIVEDSRGFDWSRYAIAWLKIPSHLKGGDAETAKHNILHRRVDRIAAQSAGDHFTYTLESSYQHPPSLMSRPY
jgi:hypothetical protein